MRKTLRDLMRLLDDEGRRQLPLIITLMLVGSFLEVIGVSMMVPIVTVLMNPEVAASRPAVAWLLNLMPSGSSTGFVPAAIAFLIALFVFKTVFLAFEYRMQNRFTRSSRFRLQARLLHTFLSRPYEYFLNVNTGDVLRAMGSSVSNSFDMMSNVLLATTELVVSTVLVLTIFIISPLMTTLIACIMLVTVLVIAKVLRPILRHLGFRSYELNSLTSRWLMQSVRGIKEIKVGQHEGFFERQYLASGNEAARIDEERQTLLLLPRLLIEMVCVCSVLGVLGIMYLRGASVESLLPELSAFAMAAVKLMPSANRIVASVNRLSFFRASLTEVLENLDEAEQAGAVLPSAEAPEPLPFEREIGLSDISYRYPNTDVDVLSHINLVIEKGSCVGIMGPSGAGKTTLVDIMLGLLEPYDGKVLLDGVDVSQNPRGWLAHVGYIPQSIFMLDDTIGANVSFGHPYDSTTEERIWEALEEAQLADFVRGLPEGLDTQVGERGVRLSGGQQQRIGIARTLFGRPDVLVFDEATSSLDNVTESEVMEAIYGLQGKRTMVIIAHRLSTIERCDHLFEVRDGSVTQRR